MWHYGCKDCAVKEPLKCQTCETGRFLGDCEAAIDLISWYLHHYHQADFGHQEMIGDLQTMIGDIQQVGFVAEFHRRELLEIERRVDTWLYQVI